MTAAGERIARAQARVTNDPRAGTRKGSHTMQTRYIVAALGAIGVKRSDYRARVVRERDGSYGDAIGSPYTPEAHRLIREHADELAEYGQLRVHLIAPEHAFVATGHPAGVVRHYLETR